MFQTEASSGVDFEFAYIDYENEFAAVGFGSYPIATDALLVGSLGVMIDAMLAAVEADSAGTANFNLLKTIGR